MIEAQTSTIDAQATATAVIDNPLRAGLAREEAPEPCVIVIFGATGDLAHRKLFPALFDLACQGQLPAHYSLIGVGRTEMTTDQFREDIHQSILQHSRPHTMAQRVWEEFGARLTLLSGDFSQSDCYQNLKGLCERDDQQFETQGNRLYFFSIAPDMFNTVFSQLCDHDLLYRDESGRPWTRVMVEKPFGSDLVSATKLNDFISSRIAERQIFRIDHYLGKETVQNILVFRFGNGIFEPIWNRRYIDHVQITVSESLGSEARGAYYDHAGISRDMMQNHMLQVLSLTGMEPPVSLDPDDIRDEKVKLLHAVRRLKPEEVATEVVRGQYGPGFANGKPAIGYRDEIGVAKESGTETFLAAKMFIDNWRWVGVPFYLRSGKRLPRQATEVVIQFKMPPLSLFPHLEDSDVEPNLLVIHIQPEEGIALKMSAKVPGPTVRIQPVRMDFRYGTAFGAESPSAYERLFLDAMIGRTTLFTRRDEVEASWRVMMPILDAWKTMETPKFPNYDAGTWGPQTAFDMMERDGRTWHRP
ncbi:MAG TPA: glucose-6-phosphate dehydrogenase [Armatimonadota bacterium]|nr:glucose-6-phosphate dehydrogenase [Armatimonadota bacterium]